MISAPPDAPLAGHFMTVTVGFARAAASRDTVTVSVPGVLRLVSHPGRGPAPVTRSHWHGDRRHGDSDSDGHGHGGRSDSAVT
jgi:hypothetical protein